MHTQTNYLRIFVVVFILALFVIPQFAYALNSNNGVNVPQEKYAKGRIIVKFKDLDQCAHCLIKNKNKFKGEKGNVLDSVEKLNKKFKVKGAKSLFFERHGLNKKDAKAEAVRQIELIKMKHPNRARKIKQENLPDLTSTYVLELPLETDVIQAVAEYKNDPNVEYAEIDTLNEVNVTTNDPSIPWGITKIKSQLAWDTTMGEGIVVAVVDTGIDYNHPDLAANVYSNIGEIPNNGIDDDQNGFIDDVMGWDFANNDNDPFDGHSHGTHCAGTIAAVGNNGKGVVGAAPKAKIMPLKGLSDAGSGYASHLSNAIRYAADNGADVISNSWGPSAQNPTNYTEEQAVKYAYALGAVVVFAAGNSSDDVQYYCPANMAETIAVSATDSNDNKASFSNYGNLIDVGAPGYSVYSTIPGGGYAYKSGTSMAAPHVAGLAALILANDPSLNNEAVRQIIRSSANDVGVVGFDINTGYGRINSQEAMIQSSNALEVVITAPINNAVINLDTQINVDILGTVKGSSFSEYYLEYKQIDQTTWTLAEGPFLEQVDNNVLGNFNTSTLAAGTYLIRVLALTTTGQEFISMVEIQAIKQALPVNDAPILKTIGSKQVTAGQMLAITITATDPNGDKIAYTSPSNGLMPEGASFTDNGNGIGYFTFTPNETQVGTHYVTFEVSDSKLIDSEVIAITVTAVVNNAPILSPIGPKSIDEGKTLTINFSATDPDVNDQLYFIVGTRPVGSSYVDNGDGTAVFTWQPSFSQAGTYEVTFIVRDRADASIIGYKQDIEFVTITVNDVPEPVNNPPVLDPIGNKSLKEGESINLLIKASDPDGDLVSISVSGLKSWMSFDGTNFNASPLAGNAGIYNVTFTASDGVLTDTEIITITVDALPLPPEVAPAAPTGLTAKLVLKGKTTGTQLTWTSSLDPKVTNYKVYRSVVKGGPYSLISSTSSSSYKDTQVKIAGYYYVVTAVSSSGLESVNSNEVTVSSGSTGGRKKR